jgi:N-methylhydantoinase B
MFDTPAEFLEASYPLRVLSAELRPNSGGAGKFRGGLGTVKVIEILAPCTLTVYFERTKCPPWGLNGGREGTPGFVEIHRAGLPVERKLKGDVSLEAGDRVHIIAGGGGGFGPPKERNQELVRADLERGMITAEHASREYGFSLHNGDGKR